MALMPKRVKYRKVQKGRVRGFATSGVELNFGEFGLQALQGGWISNIQIEAGRVAVSRFMKRKGKLWIRIFPDKPITKKPAETRMGKGKGNPEGWAAVVKPGRIIFEVGGITEAQAKEAFRLVASKFPIRTKFVVRGQ
jgi:large subunit ribosomal protein L16